MVLPHPRAKPRNNKPKRSFSNNVPPGLHYLLPPDPKSKKFLDLFQSFLSSKDERTTILALLEEDAKIFIEIIDLALRAAELEIDLRKIAFSVLRRLCARIGHLPESYLLSAKFDLSGMPQASGGFADVRLGAFKGKDVAVKSLRVAELDDKMRIRKRFCKEVVTWKNLSHPNVLGLIGVPDTLEVGRFSMVSEWMANGNIMTYVRANPGNHLKLLADVAEGLKYLHNADIVHGDLKGPNILITNANPVSACLADFGFMTIVHDPGLGMQSSKSELGGGTTPFMPPELLVPYRFGIEKCIPTKEADVYAMGMVIYQVLTGTTPFGKQTGPEVVIKVVRGVRPSKPANARDIGLSDQVWELLEGCWEEERSLRPPVRDVLARLNLAASARRILPRVGAVVQGYVDVHSGFNKFDPLFLGMAAAMDRPPSQESTSSMPESLFSNLSGPSEAETSITDPALMSTEALEQDIKSKNQSMEDIPAFFFELTPAQTPHLHPATDISRSSTPRLEGPSRPRRPREDPGLYQNNIFAQSSCSNRTVSPRLDQPRYDTGVLHDRETHVENPSMVDPEVDPSFCVIPDSTTVSMSQARDHATRQMIRPGTSTPPSYGPRSRLPTEPDARSQPDDNAKHKHRQSRFHIRQTLSKVFHADPHKPPS